MGTGLGAVALVAASVAGLGVLAPDGDPGQVVASRPPVGEVAEAFAASDEPLGTWEQVADPPFSPRMNSFTGTASDGRVVVWGGSLSADGGGAEGGGVLTDGGVYDVESGTWDAIPPAPVPQGVSFHWTHLADDRLMVLGSPDGSELIGAVYDLASRRWTEIESPPTIELPAEGIAWTGDTLALARLFPFDADERQTGGPGVERWSFASGEWTTGAKIPLSPRRGSAVAFDGGRLGIWGGSNGQGLLDDGAIYDISADRWEPMTKAPLPPTAAATAVWLERGLAVASGQVAAGPAADRSAAAGVSEVEGTPGLVLYPSLAGAVYHPDTQTWAPLSDVPNGHLGTRPEQPFVFDGGHRHLVASAYPSSPGSISYYDEVVQAWQEAPFGDLHEIDGTLVVTSRTRGGPGDDHFQVQVQVGSVWEPATEAPFVNRMDAGVAVVDQGLLVVGGAEGPDLEITGDAWILRFDR
jgi:hypothetical protein